MRLSICYNVALYIPPSNGSNTPVMNGAAGEHRKTAARANSSTVPRRLSGDSSACWNYSPNLMPCASGNSFDQLITFDWRRM